MTTYDELIQTSQALREILALDIYGEARREENLDELVDALVEVDSDIRRLEEIDEMAEAYGYGPEPVAVMA